MLWVNVGEKSYQVTGININLHGDKSELWAERPSGKTMKLLVANEDEIKEHKEAIDYAVSIGAPVYTIM